MYQALVNFLILLETKKTHFFKFLYKCYLKIYPSTVKPVYNGHPWDLKKVAVWKRGLIKVRFWLAVDESNRPLLTGGRCSEVAVKAGLTVYLFLFLNTSNLSATFNIIKNKIDYFLVFKVILAFNTWKLFLYFQKQQSIVATSLYAI